jgi:hypothetical protein
LKHTQNQNTPPRGLTRIAALLLAALSGSAVMVVELGVARILTPVFGGSISVWAIVIATTMLALAAVWLFLNFPLMLGFIATAMLVLIPVVVLLRYQA